MARDKKIEVCALNIAANPHPTGVYERLLNAIAGVAVNVRGSDFAKITKPVHDESNGVLLGRILVWADIDLKGRWLDLETGEQLSPEVQSKIQIPANAKPNYRTFNYIFHLRSHRLYYESVNEFGETLGPTVARRLFGDLLIDSRFTPPDTEISVTVIPTDGAVEEILKLPGLRILEVSLQLPNDDEVSPEERRRIYDRLRSIHAKKLEEKVVKAAGAARLTPDDELKNLANLAAENGAVRGQGRVNDVTTNLSTTDAPRREKVSMEAGNDFLSRVMATIGFF